MARPEKFNAEYFSHDKNMRNDPKVKALRRKFKHGYAVWNMLLEELTGADHFMLAIDPLVIELLAGDFDVEPEELEDIIKYCVKIQLFSESDGFIFSCGHKKRLQPVLDNRNAVKKRFLDKKLKTDDVSKVNNTQSKVKESKVKETIKVVVVEEASLENFETENQEDEILEIIPDVYIDEEEKAAAVEFLKRHSYFNLVQKQFSLKPPEVFKLFDFFLNKKIADNELKGRTKDEIVKNFYYWIPKYQQANRPQTKTNGTANNNSGRTTTSAAGADAKREDRKQLTGKVTDHLRGLLQGTEPKQ